MSYLYVPEIDKKVELFGKNRGDEMAKAANAPLLGQLPIDPELAKLCDEGNIELHNTAIYNEVHSKGVEIVSGSEYPFC
jgi:hypothetical protein